MLCTPPLLRCNERFFHRVLSITSISSDVQVSVLRKWLRFFLIGGKVAASVHETVPRGST